MRVDRDQKATALGWCRSTLCRVSSAVAVAIVVYSSSSGAISADPPPGRFVVAFHDEVTAYEDAAAFVLPDEAITFEVLGGSSGDYALSAPTGALAQFGARKWQWTAPHKPGIYTVQVRPPKPKIDAALQAVGTDVRVFVMIPASEVRDGWLNGYRIGAYPAANGNPAYAAPLGFVEVTKQNQDTKVSPHFRLNQFVCKQAPADGFPKYVALDERLPLKLEAVLAAVGQAGFDADTLHVMSGYRTPFYNHAIGDVAYSMHQWGRAADVYVDRRDKGVMDDLNGDNRIDVGDARFLYDLVERLLAQPSFHNLQGGMGYYPATAAHPPFVHVDVRGTKARWKG